MLSLGQCHGRVAFWFVFPLGTEDMGMQDKYDYMLFFNLSKMTSLGVFYLFRIIFFVQL